MDGTLRPRSAGARGARPPLGALLALGVLLGAGCGERAPAPAHPASAASTAQATAPAPAAAFAAVLPLLRSAGPPVYLPSWLPPLPPDRTYALTARADARTYRVDIGAGGGPSAAALPGLPQKDRLATLSAGAPGALDPLPSFAFLAAPGAGQRVDLGGGLEATFWAQAGPDAVSLLQWRQAGWTLQVADVTGLGLPAERLVGDARRLAGALPAGSAPVPWAGGGIVVETVTADGAPTWVDWRHEGWEYRVQGSGPDALRLAGSLVRVDPGR